MLIKTTCLTSIIANIGGKINIVNPLIDFDVEL